MREDTPKAGARSSAIAETPGVRGALLLLVREGGDEDERRNERTKGKDEGKFFGEGTCSPHLSLANRLDRWTESMDGWRCIAYSISQCIEE